MLLNQIIKQLRISQWVKNGFVFLPMFFAGQMIDIWCWQQCFVAFLSFSFMASAVYCINDLKDVEADRNHPIKCQRPLPSGKITVLAVRLLTILLIASSLLISGLLKSAWTTAILTIYLVLNIMYCYKLKQYAIIDVFILSMGFVLRLFAGGISCHIVLSPWIVSLTFLIALFLTFAKRRDDVVILDQTGKTMRRNTKRYNIQFLNQTLSIVGTITIVCYIMYTVSDDVMCRFGSRYLYTTSIFVLAGILRYLQLTIVDNRSGSPTKILLKDTFIQVCIGCWILMFIGIIYIYIYIVVRQLAIFDFDGTLTRHDSFISFAKFAVGERKFYLSFVITVPWLLLWKLRVISNSKVKEHMFKLLYRGMTYSKFKQLGIEFAKKLNADLNKAGMDLLSRHQEKGDDVYILSASIREWIEPWAKLHGIKGVISTEIEVDKEGRITGNFRTHNCHGQEKVRRAFKEIVGLKDSEWWAYGDSKSDSYILNLATHGIMLK